LYRKKIKIMKKKWEDFKDWFYYYNEIFIYIIVIVIVFVLSYWAYIRFDTGYGTKIIHKENCKYCTERKLIELYKK
jgi:hypothetical protein